MTSPHPFWSLSRPNPAWSNAAVLSQWRAIEKAVGPKWMPLKTGAKVREYGAGRYGAVLPTHTPGVVLKITTDESEALAARWLSKQKRPPKGVVRYYRVLELPVTHRARTVYLLWREEANYVGAVGLWARGKNIGARWRLEDKMLEQSTSTAQSLVRRLRSSPAQSRAFSKDATTGFEAAMKRPQGSMIRRFLELQRRPAGAGVAQTTERVMLGARILTHGKILPEVGRAMIEAFRRGVFLSDVHAGNIGVARGVVVITDPGNAIPVRAR